jgi:hypothetical protein
VEGVSKVLERLAYGLRDQALCHFCLSFRIVNLILKGFRLRWNLVRHALWILLRENEKETGISRQDPEKEKNSNAD